MADGTRHALHAWSHGIRPTLENHGCCRDLQTSQTTRCLRLGFGGPYDTETGRGKCHGGAQFGAIRRSFRVHCQHIAQAIAHQDEILALAIAGQQVWQRHMAQLHQLLAGRVHHRHARGRATGRVQQQPLPVDVRQRHEFIGTVPCSQGGDLAFAGALMARPHLGQTMDRMQVQVRAVRVDGYT